MPRGGKREGAGGKFAWRHGETKPIRIPVALVDDVMRIARMIDEGKPIETVTESKTKVLDLTGVAIFAHRNGPAVYLADLIRAGYRIYPERLVRFLKPLPDKSLTKNKDIDSFLSEFLVETKNE